MSDNLPPVTMEDKVGAMIMILGALLERVQKLDPELKYKIVEGLEVSKSLMADRGKEPHKTQFLRSVECALRIAREIPE